MDQEQTNGLLSYIEQVRERTLWAALCIPVERLERAIAPMRFTFGDILRHVAATERYVFVENVSQRRLRYPGHDTALANGYGGVMRYMAELHQESVSILRSLGSADVPDHRCYGGVRAVTNSGTRPGGVAQREAQGKNAWKAASDRQQRRDDAATSRGRVFARLQR